MRRPDNHSGAAIGHGTRKPYPALLLAAFLIVATVGAGAHAESFNQRVKKANRQLASGDADGALSMFRDLQTDEPESPLLYYGQGCALFQQGLKEADAPTPEHAIEAFKAARESFEKASLSSDDDIRLKALYNRATSTSELATQLTKGNDPKAAIDTFNDAIAQYEDLLKRRPDDTASQNNLNHTRYLLKKFLQNPPKQQEQKNQSGQGKNEKKQKDSDKQQNKDQKNESQGANGDKKDQQGKEGQDKQQQEQKQAQQQNEDGKKDADKNGKPKDDDKTSEQEKQNKLAEAKKNENQQQPGEQKAGQPGEEKADKQSINAILDSLEAQDNREQRDLQNPSGNIAMRRDWW